MITYASIDDTKAVYDLLCDWMEREFDYEAFQPAYEQYLKDGHITVFTAREDGKVIGFMTVRVDFQLHHMSNVAEILEFAVARDRRWNGIEHELVAKAIEVAREHSCECIEVCARRTNEKTHRFYERKGFNKSHYKLKMPLKY